MIFDLVPMATMGVEPVKPKTGSVAMDMPQQLFAVTRYRGMLYGIHT
jgi:hypothetical protein